MKEKTARNWWVGNNEQSVITAQSEPIPSLYGIRNFIIGLESEELIADRAICRELFYGSL